MGDEKIIKKMVTEMVEKNQLVMPKEDLSNFKKLVPALIDKGVDNLNLSMFSNEMKLGLLNALGDEYLRKGKVPEAIKVFILSGNRKKLVEIGEDYEKIGMFSDAIDAYRLAGDHDKLLKTGNKCLS